MKALLIVILFLVGNVSSAGTIRNGGGLAEFQVQTILAEASETIHACLLDGCNFLGKDQTLAKELAQRLSHELPPLEFTREPELLGITSSIPVWGSTIYVNSAQLYMDDGSTTPYRTLQTALLATLFWQLGAEETLAVDLAQTIASNYPSTSYTLNLKQLSVFDVGFWIRPERIEHIIFSDSIEVHDLTAVITRQLRCPMVGAKPTNIYISNLAWKNIRGAGPAMDLSTESSVQFRCPSQIMVADLEIQLALQFLVGSFEDLKHDRPASLSLVPFLTQVRVSNVRELSTTQEHSIMEQSEPYE